jgi:signal peptidase
MEPAFYRGDLLFLTNPVNQRYQTGDITVYKIPGADIPIVHRVLETHDDKKKDKQLLLTKGDNNYVDDLELYQGLQWLERKHIVGKVRGCAKIYTMTFPYGCLMFFVMNPRFLPYIGYVTIAMVCTAFSL